MNGIIGCFCWIMNYVTNSINSVLIYRSTRTDEKQNNVSKINLHKKSFKRPFLNLLGLKWTPVRAKMSSTWWNVLGVAGLARSLQEQMDNSSRRSQKNQRCLNNCKAATVKIEKFNWEAGQRRHPWEIYKTSADQKWRTSLLYIGGLTK